MIILKHIRALKNVMIDTHPGITLSQLEFLFMVHAVGKITHTEAAAQMGLTNGAISRMLDVFGSKKKKTGRHKNLGLVQDTRDVDDDRIKHISMTTKGNLFICRYFATIESEL